MDNYKVYKHTFPNGKVYIGITGIAVKKRWRSGGGYSAQEVMNRAIHKYGWENIQHEVLYTGLTKEQAESKEIELIAFYKSNQREYGYNVENGGNCVGTVSEETKRRISKTKTGTHHSEETKRKIGLASKNRSTKQHKRRIGMKVLRVEDNVVYDSIMQASEQNNVTRAAIHRCLKGISETSNGYHWQYINNSYTKTNR